MQKPILILFGTHGDEYYLKQCLDFIQSNHTTLFDTLDVNELAIEQNKRYLIHNMNRTAPGDSSSHDYELKRGAYIQEIMKKYQIVIDIHGTDSDTGSFILLPKVTPAHLFLSALFGSENIVSWQSGIHKETGPIVAFHPLGLEIETGPMNDNMIRELGKNINLFLENYKKRFTFGEIEQELGKKTVFEVVASVSRTGDIVIPMKDFESIVIGGIEYFSLLTQNPYLDIACYLMKKRNIQELFLTSGEYFFPKVVSIS